MVVKPDQDSKQAPAKQQEKPANERVTLGPGALSGNLTADPELRYTPSGRAVCQLRVAVSERRQDPDTGKWIDGPTEFFNVTCWGTLAENCAEHLLRGMRVVGEGTWAEEKWTSKEGEIRTTMVLTARDLGPSMIFYGARVLKPERQKS